MLLRFLGALVFTGIVWEINKLVVESWGDFYSTNKTKCFKNISKVLS